MATKTKKRASKIGYAQLIDKIQQNKIRKSEIEKYFRPTENGPAPFIPGIEINPDHVNISGIEDVAQPTADRLARYALAAATKPKRSSQLRAGSTLQAAAAPQIVAEGDSWFSLRVPFYPDTLVDILGNQRHIENIATLGDELDRMVADGQHLRELASTGAPALIFSGGGNDVVGNGRLEHFLRQRVSGDTDPNNAPNYVKTSFYTMLDGVIDLWADLCDQVHRDFPGVVIFGHGYDYVLPKVNGRWLGTPLEKRGFHPHWQKPMARAIIRVMMNAYNSRLSDLQNDKPNFQHVRLLGSVGERQWFDELHPKTAGARKLAERYNAALTSAGFPPAVS